MAYEIYQRTEADYRWFRFEAPSALLDSLDHNLKIADGVLRFRIFKVDPDAPVMVPPAADRRTRRRASAPPRAPVPAEPARRGPEAEAADRRVAAAAAPALLPRCFCGKPSRQGESRAARPLRLEPR